MKTNNSPKDAALREALRRMDMMKEKRNGPSLLRRIAAIFLAAAFIGGLAFATFSVLAPQTKSPQSAQVTTNPLPLGGGREGASIRFSDIRLDSILTVVAAHYGKAVCFRDTATQALRLSTIWDSEDSLAVFIATLNEFDGLLLKEERDTVFVEGILPSPSLKGRE